MATIDRYYSSPTKFPKEDAEQKQFSKELGSVISNIISSPTAEERSKKINELYNEMKPWRIKLITRISEFYAENRDLRGKQLKKIKGEIKNRAREHFPRGDQTGLGKQIEALIKSDELIQLGYLNYACDCMDNIKFWGEVIQQNTKVRPPFVMRDTREGLYKLSEKVNSQWIDYYSVDIALMEKLDLNSVGLTSLPNNIHLLKELRFLEAPNNKLTKIPEEISQLKHLMRLNLMNNRLDKPIELPNNKYLIELNLDGNRIPENNVNGEV